MKKEKKKLNRIEQVVEVVQLKLESAPGCHDWEHTARVLHNARIITSRESLKNNIDLKIIEAAAILHDVARLEELNSNGKICHASLGAKLALDILPKCGFCDDTENAKIAECIKRHRFRGKNDAPETIEQKIIYDADKLDSIGAVGLGRAIHFSGRIGSALHNTKKEALASDAYSSGDTAYREYLVKLKDIPSKLLTTTARSMAVKRAEFMHTFFDTLNNEIY
jgi:uncharacterized protein